MNLLKHSRNVRRFTKIALVAGLASATIPAAAIDVFLEFRTGAEVLLGGSWTGAGYPGSMSSLAFGPSDFLAIQHSVKAKMETIYSGHTITFHNFSDVPGGTYTKLDFSFSGGSAGLLGVSPTLDWLNSRKDETVGIYSGKFAPTLNGGTTAAEKAADLDRLSTALANIAAHELGHSIGLQHYDAYGQPDLRAPAYSGVSGAQNSKIMSSGPSGASLHGLGDALKTFSDLSKVKLAFADGVVAAPGPTVTEAAGFNGSFASAQSVIASALPGLGVSAVNISGGLSTSGDDDYYSFDAVMGSLMTFNTFSDGIFADSCNTRIELFNDTGGLMFSNDDISYDPTSFMSGAGPYGTDSLIMNYEAPYTGKYYVRVFGTDAGDYDLLAVGVVPEPGSLALISLCLVGFTRRRRQS